MSRKHSEGKKGGESSEIPPIPFRAEYVEEVVRLLKVGLHYCQSIGKETKEELEGWVLDREEELNLDQVVIADNPPDKDEVSPEYQTGVFMASHSGLPGSMQIDPTAEEPAYPPPDYVPVTPEEAGSAEGAAAINAERDPKFSPHPTIG